MYRPDRRFRSPLSSHVTPATVEANLDFTEDARADYLVAERTKSADKPALNEARKELYALFNCPEVSWGEKNDAIVHMAAVGNDLPRLRRWAANIRRELTERRERERRRRLGLAGTLAPQAA